MSTPGRPATSADVAAHAGVSRATVSHILNGRLARFPQSTRDRVHAAAEALDYRPSSAGRSLVTGRGDTIVFLMPNTTAEPNIQDAVERAAAATDHVGANVVLRFAGPDLRSTVGAILGMRPLGVVDFGVLDTEARTRLNEQGVPIAPDLDAAGVAPIEDPDEAIAKLQVTALQERGRRRVVYAGVADGRRDAFGPRRFAHIEAACAVIGLDEPRYLHVPLDAAAAAQVLQPYWTEGPVGVAAYNDAVAVAVLSAAADHGIDVPHSLSVVGNDHTAIGQLWRPRLASVDVDIRVIVDHAIAQLLIAADLDPSPLRETDHRPIRLVRGDTI